MRVLIDYRPALRNRSGAGEYIHRLALALAAGACPSNGSRSTAHSLTSPDRPLSVTIFSSSWKDRLRRETLGDLAAIDRRVPVAALNLLWHRLEWPSIELLTGGRFDVVHSPHPLLLPARHAAQVVTIHDLHFLVNPERTQREVRRDYPRLARAHAQRADRVIVPSRYTAALVEERLGVPSERISLCPPGAPDWPPRERAPKNGYILFIGTLEPRKNLGILLRAYGLIAARRPDFPRLVLVGFAPPEAVPILDIIGRAPLAGKVEHLGYVSSDRQRAVYEGACAVVIPSLDEGFGLPALEAMTLGVPVVASNRGALPELVGPAGVFFDPESPEAIGDALERLLDDRDGLSRLSQLGLAQARRFSWQAAAEAAIEAYRGAIARRGNRG